MEDLVKILSKSQKFNKYITDIENNKFPMNLSGLTDVAKVHMAYATSFYTNNPFILITYNEIQAKKIVENLKYFTPNIKLFPKKEIVSYDIETESRNIINERSAVLNSLVKKEKPIIVTTIEAVMQKIILKKDFEKDILKINIDEEYNLDDIKKTLVKLGYEYSEIVEGKGQFSIRGGIIDISPVDIEEAIRIEFWGDIVDSIRLFDIQTQRSIRNVENVIVYPCTEFLLVDSIDNICDDIIKRKNNKELKNIVLEDIENIKNSNYHNKMQKYFDSFYKNSETILEYLDTNYIIFVDEIARIKQRSSNIIEDNSMTVKLLIEKQKIVPDGYLNNLEYDDYAKKIETKNIVYFEKLDNKYVDKNNMHAKRNGYSFSCREVNFFRSSMDLFIQEIQEATKENKSIIILAGNMQNSKNMLKILTENEISAQITDDENIANNVVTITTGALSSGVKYDDFDLLIISSEELFKLTKKRRYRNQSFKNGEKILVSDLNIGDYIVHQTHGIGQYVGINTLEVDKLKKDYIKIKYKNDDILYVPTDQLDNIRKYVGASDNPPRLNKMGSKEWERTKAKVSEALKNIAKGLIELYAKRSTMQGYSFSKDTVWQNEFEESFPYQETEDQLRCIDEVKRDMERSIPMDRLLCGDVGYGKTEVAIRSAFKACMDSKQVAYLVPTTILASQQYNSFYERMKEFPIKVEVLNRFKTKKEQSQILKKLELGEIDILIGTHRLLSKDVKFKSLGLLIIDEEHRFGVEHKEVIKKIKNNVDVLTMTATPIPRTLHMSIIGVRDMSVIYEPPESRIPVQTYVLEYDTEVIKEAIIKELERQGQVFYLYNKVEGIIKKTNEIQEAIPEAKVAYAHGKMSGSELEEIMIDFMEKKIDVLVCTTILESGIDIPNANTIIVENADRLGLAQLYQIRGRVGRSDKKAYAYITYRRNKILSEVAEKRLKAIREYTEFGSGFKIAMRDLEIRGAGNILGPEQHRAYGSSWIRNVF